MGLQFGAYAEYHPRTRAPTLALVEQVSKQDFDGITMQRASNQVLVPQPTEETSEDFRLRGRDSHSKDALLVRLMGDVQCECVGRIDHQKSGDVLPALETLGSSGVRTSGLRSHLLEHLKNVIEGVAVVGEKGIGGVGAAFGSLDRFVDEERVVFGRRLADSNSHAHFSFGRFVFRIRAPGDDATQDKRRGVARGAKEYFHFGVTSWQKLSGDFDEKPIGRKTAGDAFETGAVDDRNQTADRTLEATLADMCG
jgi:hypothetical protein